MFNAPGLRTASPSEVQYSPYTFTIDKCSEASQLANPGADPDCAGTPYNQLFRVYIETELRNEPRGAMNDQVSFEVSIGNYCELDEISFDPASLINSMTYTLRTPAEYFRQDLIITQTYPDCPAVCTLTMANGDSLDMTLGISNPYPNPFLEIETGDKNLNNANVGVTFTCTSTLSQMGPDSNPSTDSTTVSINYVDECY